jgi:YesN/AraC family two-component response regulator
MTLYIKSMVSLRCKMMVQHELTMMGLHEVSVDLGRVVIEENISNKQREQLGSALHESGLELLEDKQEILIERVKNVVTEMVHYAEDAPTVNFSVFLSEKLGYDYVYLANLFSEAKGYTIEHFIIANKIERVKELILENEMNLTEISYNMHYSSVSHLSAQFKKVTGITPSHFKTSHSFSSRQSLESI